MFLFDCLHAGNTLPLRHVLSNLSASKICSGVSLMETVFLKADWFQKTTNRYKVLVVKSTRPAVTPSHVRSKNLHVNTNSRHEPEAFQLHGAKRASKDSELRTSQYIYIYMSIHFCTIVHYTYCFLYTY